MLLVGVGVVLDTSSSTDSVESSEVVHSDVTGGELETDELVQADELAGGLIEVVPEVTPIT